MHMASGLDVNTPKITHFSQNHFALKMFYEKNISMNMKLVIKLWRSGSWRQKIVPKKFINLMQHEIEYQQHILN